MKSLSARSSRMFFPGFFKKAEGQASIDLILALMVLVLFLNFFIVFGNNLEKTSAELNIRHQEKNILNELKSVLENASADLIQIDYEIPRINHLGNARGCWMAIENGQIQLNATDANGMAVNEDVQLNNPLLQDLLISDVNCGQTLTIQLNGSG